MKLKKNDEWTSVVFNLPVSKGIGFNNEEINTYEHAGNKK